MTDPDPAVVKREPDNVIIGVLRELTEGQGGNEIE